VIRATLYIIGCTARNRFRLRLRRLREPRYLIGAVAGIGYLIFTLFIRARAYDARGGSTASGDAMFAAMGPTVGGVLLALAALASWAVPLPSGLLDFSKAEIAFLFPAPMTRGRLVFYRILRSQALVFTAALIMALAYPTGSLAARARGLVSVWVLLMTIRTFFAIVVLARAGARLGDGRVRVFGWPAVVLPVGALAVVVWPVLTALRELSTMSSLSTVGYLAGAVFDAASNEAAQLLLFPFRALLTPLFATGLGAFLAALPGALATYGFTVLWLVWADGLYTEYGEAAAEREVSKHAPGARRYVARPIAWRLAGTGPVEVAFLWKGVLQTFRTVDRRVLLRVVVLMVWLVGASLFVTQARGVVLLLGVGATWGALFSVFMLPQMLRLDLRQDLEYVALLRTWPVRGAAVLRGEILWPAMLVVAIAWAFGAIAMGTSLLSSSRIPSPNRIAAWTSFLILCPGVVLAQYTVHNAVAVLFPGWVPIGPSRPRGVDAVGQRLILLLGNWIGLLLALIPGLAVMALLSFALRRALGPVVLPIGALVTTVAVFGEVWVATELLGRAYEQLDVTSVERPD